MAQSSGDRDEKTEFSPALIGGVMYPIGKIANSYKAATGILPAAGAVPKRTSAAAD